MRLLISSIYFYNITPTIPILELTNNAYYLEFDYLKEKRAILLDSNNVSYVDYSKIKSLGVDNLISYNPITIGMMGIRYYHDYMEDSTLSKKNTLLNHSDWLVNNIDSSGFWKINHSKKIDNFSLVGPWPSSLAQGFGISCLTRAYVLTQDSVYLKTVDMAVSAFLIKTENGGFSSENEFGVFYEEYPVEVPDHVLNGYVYSLFGLYDAYKIGGNDQAKELFDVGIKSLKTILPKYDSGNWTKYSLNETSTLKNHWNYASPFYQKIHLSQMQGLYLITQDDMFLKYNIKFENQSSYSWVNLIIYPSYVVYTDFVLLFKFFR